MSEKKVLIDVHTSSNIHEKKSVPTQWLTGVFLMRNYGNQPLLDRNLRARSRKTATEKYRCLGQTARFSAVILRARSRKPADVKYRWMARNAHQPADISCSSTEKYRWLVFIRWYYIFDFCGCLTAGYSQSNQLIVN